MKIIRFLIILSLLIITSCSTVTNTGNSNNKISKDVYELYLKSRLALKNEDIDSSISFMKDAIDIDGSSITLTRDLASLYLRKDQKEEALETIENYLKGHPKSSEALMIKGRIKELLNHSFESVTQTYEQAITLNKKKSAAYLFLGDMYYNQKKYEDSKRIYNKFIEVFPKNFLGYYYLGKIAVTEKKYEDAKKYLNKSISITSDVSSLFLLAKAHIGLKEINEAEDIYKKVLIIDPLNVKAIFDYSLITKEKDNFYLVYLGKNLTKKKFLLENIISYVNELKRDPDSIRLLKIIARNTKRKSSVNYYIGVLYERIKETNNALKYYKMVKPKSDSYVKASISIASILQNQKKLKESASVLNKVHLMIPENEEIILYLGIMYGVLKDYDKAENILKKGIKLNDNNYSLHYRLGIIYDSKKKKDLMYEEMKKVIALKPDHANALNYLGYSYADSGINLDEAEKLIKKALEYKPDDGYITDSLGWVYYKKGMYKEASSYIKLALEKVPNDPVVLEHFADILLKLNDHKSALEYYEKALKYNESDKEKLIKKINDLKGK